MNVDQRNSLLEHGLLRIVETTGVVHLQVRAPLPPGASAARLVWEIVDACRGIDEREGPLAAVVLESGGGAFWREPPRSPEDVDASAGVWGEATAAIARLAPPTIAAIAGDAIGPAWHLALACDLRLCAATARVGSPEIRWGRIPSAGGTQRLPRLVGPGQAMWLLLRGEILSGEEALRLGLVHRAVPGSELGGCVEDALAGLRGAAPVALAYAKEAAAKGVDLPLADGLRLEADLAALLQTTSDRAEGVRAFLERRKPRFEGR